MKKRKYGRIITLSGGGIGSGSLPFFTAYGASKAAVVRFSETLAEEVRSHGITVNSIAPGGLNTRFLDETLRAGPTKVGKTFYERARKQKAEGGASLENAAQLVVFLASDASCNLTGKLFSAVWDPWDKLAAHGDELADSDVYTLRRILPKDRGLSWEES